ncbi:CRISPR-associated protein Cas4 [Acanthopleuribacter pedis]|uniref:CRISPR-associated exonuclease Cas4 n=1 Tax=Acanthopleuribacter pedis TaxID=442870 RepID=A0A8J7QH46_9BACT|nr:CRISPR-associated protein Cas4 [Acanthopleuribacter pedis]MBO1318505.1 CRISPR-associated protein Cas4 [Acanthopleuribacter pedis]
MMVFTVSEVMAHQFCPRFTWFGGVLGIAENQERDFKVRRGREVHADKEAADRGYLRQRLGVVDKEQGVYLGRPDLPFRGIVDEVLFMADGSAAPLDWKFAEYKERVFKTYRLQAVIYAILIERIYEKPVKTAYVVYVRSQNKLVEVPITRRARGQVEEIHAAMSAVHGGIFPPATKNQQRCMGCTYRNLCPR